MKKHILTQWERNQYFNGLLLFAQTLEESTFHYSYDSYKLPALNSHFLCYDILYTVRDLENKVLMDGNFVPLSKEFEYAIQNDSFIKTVIDPQDTLLYAKNKNGKYQNLVQEDYKTKIKPYSEIAKYIISISETNNNYLTCLLEQINDNIFTDNFSQENSTAIYNLTRTLVTDLVNSGYSKEYIYATVLDVFFNSNVKVLCHPNTIADFFNRFTFEEKHYQILFGINKKGASIFERLENFTVRKATEEEKKSLNLQKSANCILTEITALDAHSAFEEATRCLNTYISLHQINQHDSKIFFTQEALVSQQINKVYDKSILIQTSINPIKKQGNTSNLHAIVDDIYLTKHVQLPSSFYRAIALHSGAINNTAIANQLLNLWTIVEILIETKRDNEDKINTICTILTAVLNRCYMYSNIAQLYKDIKTCTDNNVDSILTKVKSDIENLDMVEKLALLLAVDTYKNERDELINCLADYPLLIYRLNMFSQFIFKDSSSIYDYLQKHEKRIKWHIMRIYRNRNMIVHNGSSLPYRTIIVENLHYYVDVLLDTLIEYYCLGISDHSNIFKDILHKQNNHCRLLGISMEKNGKNSTVLLTKENALRLIFNGYSGNVIKKTITQILDDKVTNNKEPLSLKDSSTNS